MKTNELKKVLKPLIKQCIKEVIFEEGVLSGIISEVVKGVDTAPVIREQRQISKPKPNNELAKKKIQEQKTKSESMARQEQYASTIKAALQQAGIAPTSDTIRLAASHLYHSAEQTGYPTITWKEMVERTKGSLKEQASAVYGTLPPEQLAEYLGDDVVQKIRKHDIQKVKNNFRLNQPDVKAENVKRMPQKQMSKEEFRSKMAKIKSSLA